MSFKSKRPTSEVHALNHGCSAPSPNAIPRKGDCGWHLLDWVDIPLQSALARVVMDGPQEDRMAQHEL